MKRIRPAQAALSLPTLKLEGSLFLPEQLEKAAQGRAQAQTEADYGLPKGIRHKDEYSRAFQIACAQWQAFAADLQRSDIDATCRTIAFVHELLRDAFGYSQITPAAGLPVAELRYPLSLMAGALPVLVAPHDLALDEADARFAVHGSGSRKKSPFQAMQELLNASPDHQWGMVSNGRQLRLLRDAASLTRPSFVEIDLADLLGGRSYAEFAPIWHLLHASRAQAQPSIWEQWRKQGQQEGSRVRDGLRDGVEQALLSLGTGFLQHADNHALRAALQQGRLSQDAYFQQLLRLVYRLIFVFTVEERGLLHPQDDSDAAQAARQAYAAGYALGRLRERCLKRRARNHHDDQWQAIRIVFHGLAQGEPRLALPALGGLFDPEQCPDLDAAGLDNAHLLAALQHLRWARLSAQGNLVPVDYRNMGPEELGSVYESLLELAPSIDLPARCFGFVGHAEESSTAGNARKLSGSYYTPDSLVQALIQSALDPVIEQRLAANPARPTEALLAIRVIDPACGSGHFLLAAARRLAEKLAQLRSLHGGQEGAIRPQDYRHALREVIGHCIYGVDRNPMAIELARMALWLEGYEEGRPLSFLDHHLQVGDSLLGVMDLQTLKQGVAKDAFKPLSGDDKDVCKALAKANTAGLRQIAKDLQGQQMLLGVDNRSGLEALRTIETLPADTPEQVATKERAWQDFLQTARHSPLAQAADALVAAYLLPKTQDTADAIPTSITLHALLTAPERAQSEHAQAIAAAHAACEQAHVLHWPLAFPQVFAQGGFDCVLGNPPWERIKLQEEEFFATRHRDVATARNKAERNQRIQWLSEGMLARHLYPDLAHEAHQDEAEKRLYREFVSARRSAEAASVFAHVKADDGGRYPLTGVGDVNTYALFAETILHITAFSPQEKAQSPSSPLPQERASGRAGFIVPTGIATDDSTKAYFGHITQQQRLVSLYDIENREAVFPSVHRSYKFCLLTLGAAERAEFVCFASQVSQLDDPRRRFTLTPEEFRLINPNTLTCPVFRSERDAELTKKLYRAAPVLIRDVTTGSGQHARTLQAEHNPWGIEFMRMLDMSNDSHLFKDRPGANDLPLFEAKLIHQFDHRWATYTADGDSRDVTPAEKTDPDFTITPRYWVSRSEVDERLCKRDRDGHITWQWDRQWLMGWRDICRATDERTVIATVVPRVGAGDTLLLMFPDPRHGVRRACLLADQCSLVHDYVARQKIGGTHLKYHVKKQIVNLPPDHYTEADLAFIVPRVLELTYTAHDLSAWAQDLGYDGPPFAFDPDRRATLRAELDAYYAKLYGLTREELRYILDPADIEGDDYPSETFRVLKNKELTQFNEYRTQRLVLQAWQALQARPPVTAPVLQPVRRALPRLVYMENETPASESEDWLAGLVCDVLLQAGPCDDNRLRRILLASLPEDTPFVEDLRSWIAHVSSARWVDIDNWLHKLLGVPVTAPLSIRQPAALAEVIGDHRTQSLASALIKARRRQETKLEEAQAKPAPAEQFNQLRKQG
ncbi:Eco57I restriction-modification methylase domain-containing protein [Vandammella animalimorsus]|uniref:site-specific DNA-methyltransferase (adenine-specific) n=1 Tax=Vandammella animalimorsus TaxID=2029117 RepID=A0A2A2AVT4_9BURK|nr:N-6 DNA methylase [Vandammella animalimorsus]PAT41769.1 restriction endonuclease [Vandammella animalimorsus]